MKGIFAFGLERIGLIGLRAPRASLVVLCIATLVSFYGVSRITFDDELRKLFRSDHPIHATYERLHKHFPGVENELMLLIEGDRPFSARQLEAIRNFHLDMQFIPGVTGVLSMFSARSPPDADGNARPLFPADLPEGTALDALVTDAQRNPLVGNKLLSADRKTALAIVALKPGNLGYRSLQSLLGDVGKLSGPLGSENRLRVTPSGAPALRFEILSAIRTDLRILNALGAVIAILVCFMFFSQPALVFIASAPPLVSVAWTVGGFGLLNQPVTSLNNVLPTLVLVIAFSDALHMVQAVRRRIEAGDELSKAVRTAVLDVGPACAMTSVTTMIACLSLTLSGSDAVREFGVAGAVAIFGAFMAVITFIPALSMLCLGSLKMRNSTQQEDGLDDRIKRATTAGWRLIARHATPVALTCVPLLLVTGTLYFLIGTDYDYREYLAADSSANRAIDRINANMGGGDTIFVLIEKRKQIAADRGRDHETVRAVHQAMAALPAVRNVFSRRTIEDWLAAASTGANAAFSGEKLPAHLTRRVVSSDRQSWLVTANIPATPATRTRILVARLERVLEPVRAGHPAYRIAPTGIIVVSTQASAHLIDGLKLSLLAAVLITISMIAISARAFVPALLSAVPNLLSLTVVASALYLLGSNFQITSVLALTIAFGIAVDNTIHVLNRYGLERRNADVGAALEITVAKVGPVLVAATAVLSLGLAVTQMSSLPMFQLFGMLCIIVLVTALLTALFILPAMILASDRNIRRL